MVRAAKRALVTGGASGIGLALSRMLLDEGYDLVLHVHTSQRSARGLVEYGSARGRDVRILVADFGKKDQTTTFCKRVVRIGESFDAVVHCAGWNEKKVFGQTTRDDFERVYGINVAAPTLLTQSLLAARLLKKGASIVLFGSMNTFSGGSTRSALYTSAKSALVGLTRSLAQTLAPSVRINCVVPGYIDTPMLTRNTDAATLRRKKERIPLKRFGEPNDIVPIVQFLISPRSAYITGQCLHVNGGALFA